MSRVAIVTGGSRGIGAAISKALLAEGYKVAANYASRDEAANAFKDDTGVEVFKWDVSDFDSCADGIKRVEDAFGAKVEVLVNNAGITRDKPMHKMNVEEWDAVVRTNLKSCFNMSRNVIDGMRESGFGRIVNISSVNAQLGQFGQTNYSAAKAGMIGFTKALARETAKKGITVNAIAPGYINTEMVQAVPANVLEKIVAQIPVGRLGEPAEIARAVLFLVDDKSGFVTGETMSINGGQFME